MAPVLGFQQTEAIVREFNRRDQARDLGEPIRSERTV
jgi:hypothetical protein